MTLNTDARSSLGGEKFKSVPRTLWHILSSTTLSRCWPVLICAGIWSSLICFLNQHTHGKLSIEPTLVTVFGTVLGFVISFRTTSSFDRYNDGRRYWTQIVFNSRIFARTVWFHVPDNAISVPSEMHPISSEDKQKYEAMTLVEKTTAINLLLAYAVAIKHYLRGEDGIFYEDLYPLVSYLPRREHRFPAIIPLADLDYYKLKHIKEHPEISNQDSPPSAQSSLSSRLTRSTKSEEVALIWPDLESQKPPACLEAELPPKHCWRSAFPFHLLHRVWNAVTTTDTRDGEDKKYCKNIPLEISLYLSSYISALQSRGVLKGNDPTLCMLVSTLNALVDALTELERVITTPIPVSYSSHLWMVTMVYCGALPFQTWSTFEWFTVPASIIASLVFFGFIVAGEEIENPFGYDKNDLNMGKFVEKIIRKELETITDIKSPTEINWVYSPDNDFIGNHAGWNHAGSNSNVKSPDDWVASGRQAIIGALHSRGGTTETAN